MTHTQGHDADFYQSFLSEMVGHHGGAIHMAKIALDRAEHPELKQLARKIVEA